MKSDLEKEAGGDILGRLAGMVTRPFVGAAKSQAIQNKVIGGITRHVNQPLENALRRGGVHKAISKIYEHGTRPIPGTPKLVQPVMHLPEQRRAYAQWRADDLVHTFAHNPEILGAIAVPVPGATETYLAGKHFAGKALGTGSPAIKKLAEYVPSFAHELEKIASGIPNGDAMEYFRDNPEKYKAWKKRQEMKKEAEVDEDDLEVAYWNFDSRVKGTFKRDPHGVLGPQEERDAFKAAVRGMDKLAEVYAYQQKTQWTCSAACLKAVMAHHGLRVPELEVIQAVGAQQGRGAECNQIAEGARKFGFEAFEFSFESLDQAKALLDMDVPIICDVQSFNNPGKGHYVVMTAMDQNRVELMDPNTPGNWRVLSRADMDARWWDRAMAPPHEIMRRWGIIVAPPEASNDTPLRGAR